jgi:hypothetical protein
VDASGGQGRGVGLLVTLALVPDLRCSGCGAGVDEHEGNLCAFCRRDDRGDNALLSHDDRGWVDRVEHVRHARAGPYTSAWTERIEHRVPCGCGCGMDAVPELEASEREPVVVPFLANRSDDGDTRARVIEALRAFAEERGEAPSIETWRRSGYKPSYSTAQRLFGTWSNAVRAAGLEPNAQYGTGHALRSFADREAAPGDRPEEVGLDALAAVIDSEQAVEVRFRHEPAEHARKLLERLGASYVIDPGAPVCVVACGRPECASGEDKPARPLAPAPPASELSSLDSLLEHLAGELER